MTAPDTTPENDTNFYIADAAILALYVIWSYVFERVASVRWLHQTGLAMVTGMIVGALLQYTQHTAAALSTDMILYALLPCIMLDAGYNLHVNEFYQYGGYVFSLGVLGSIVMFVMLHACFQHLTFNGLKGHYDVLQRHRTAMAMVLTASDTVAPLALLPREQHARLHAIVFGEAIMNDVVVLFLSTTMKRLGNPNLLDLAVKSCFDILLSSCMGVVCGLLVGWMLGWFRLVIKDGPVERPAALVLLCCYIVYGVAEKLELSGVMVMLITAVVLKYATREILEKRVDEFLTGITRTAGFLAESFMYGYFGMTFVEFIRSSTLEPPSVSFIASAACIILLCRIPVIILVRGFAGVLAKQSCVTMGVNFKRNALLPFGDVVLVGFCGTIRGVLAVVLIIRVLPPVNQRSPADNFCVQAVLTLVVIHVLVAGPLLTIFKRLLRISTDPDSFQQHTCEVQRFAGSLALEAVRMSRRPSEPAASSEMVAAPRESGTELLNAQRKSPKTSDTGRQRRSELESERDIEMSEFHECTEFATECVDPPRTSPSHRARD